MPNALTGSPNTYTFGDDFNYALWTEGTQLTLCNVPWNNDYRDIVKFIAPATLDAYINTLETSGTVINNLSYIKPGTPIKIDMPINAAMRYNYLRAANPLQPISGDVVKNYYYFITNVNYVAPNTTEISVQLDVWQTFGPQATFGNCYIERGHIGVANVNGFNNYGRDYLTIPEGLDIGNEYQIVNKRSHPIMAIDTLTSDGSHTNDQGYDILVISTTDLLADPGTVDNPSLNTAPGSNYFNLPSGAAYYVFDGYNTESFENWMLAMQNFPWITQGIISITVMPRIVRYSPTFTFNPTGPTLAPSFTLSPIQYAMYPDWRNDASIVGNIPARYRNLKKFFTYPYMSIEVTTYTGSPIIIKPESWADPDGTIVERIAPTPPQMRVTFSPYKYNAIAGSPTESFIPDLSAVTDPTLLAGLEAIPGGDDLGEYLDLSTQLDNFPTLAIVNNMAIGYMAANAHGIAFQYTDAAWSQQRALNANQTSYDQASSGMNLATDLTGIGVGAASASTAVSNNLSAQQAVVGGIAGIAGSISNGPTAIAGGVASAAMGGVNAAMNINASNQQLAIRNTAAKSSTQASVNQSGYIRDTNKSLADWSANGDYSNAIAGINAKVQDIKLTQPSVSGQVGGDTLAILNNFSRISMRVKMIDQASIRTSGEYWLRYGYPVRQFSQMPTSYMVMTKFTYWKLSETYISASMMPESFKQIIRGIFEKGVTVWADPTFIGVTDIADNEPLSGVTL